MNLLSKSNITESEYFYNVTIDPVYKDEFKRHFYGCKWDKDNKHWLIRKSLFDKQQIEEFISNKENKIECAAGSFCKTYNVDICKVIQIKDLYTKMMFLHNQYITKYNAKQFEIAQQKIKQIIEESNCKKSDALYDLCKANPKRADRDYVGDLNFEDVIAI